MASPSPHPSGWTRHVHGADGRPYWSHPQHGSSWTKPRDLKTPLELAVEQTPWDEYETKGRKYWVHRETKQTTWNMPQEITDLVERFKSASTPTSRPVPPPPQPASTPTGSASPAPLAPGPGPGANAGGGGGYSPAGLPPRPAVPTPPLHAVHPAAAATPMAPAPPVVYATYDEAAAAFKAMLRRLGVNRSWGWEMVMKEAITEPAFRALHTLAERKSVYEEFLVDEDKREQAEREASLAACRKEWNMAMDTVGGGPGFEDGVKSWWSWERGARVLREKAPKAWALPRNDDERKILFDEYIAKLRTQEETRKREMRGRNMDKTTAILQSLALDLAGPVRWSDARDLVMRTPEWHRDPELQRIEPIDLLTVFEDEVLRAEKERAEARARVAEEKRRKARKAREAFNTLLDELVASKHLTAGTSWSAIYPHVSRDPRYLSLLGLPGSSSPLDLFWDRVDDLDVAAEERLVFLQSVARKTAGLTVAEDTTEEEWRKAVEQDERAKEMGEEAIREAFETLHHRAVRVARDARRRAEKALRLAVDDLRYLFKRLDEPPVDVDRDAYEEVVKRRDVVDTPEWRALEGEDEARRSAWDKFVKRTKEKRAEREAAEQDRIERDRAYERQRDLERAQDSRDRRGSSSAAAAGGEGESPLPVRNKRSDVEDGRAGEDAGEERAKRARLGEKKQGGAQDAEMQPNDGMAEEGELP